MFLQRLVEYAEQLTLPPTLYVEGPVRYVIALDLSGRLLSREPMDTADLTTPRTRRGQPHPVPRVQRSSGVKPLLLSDNAEYTLGVARETSKPQRVVKCHRAYLDQLRRCAVATGEPAVQAVCEFLDNDPLVQLRLPEGWDAGASITFRVEGEFVVDLPAVQAFWAAENAPGAVTDGSAPVMQCLVCGARRPVLRRLQAKIKGIPGGQTSGTAIISANAEAFESYGLAESLIAPTCASCGERFTLALNHLLSERDHHIRVAGAVLVFWTRGRHEFSLRDFFDAPQAEQVRALVESLRRGQAMPEVDQAAFYAATLSASGGRAVVRDWIDTTVGEVKGHLGVWFQRQQIVSPYGEPPEPLGLYALAAATVRDVNKDLSPPTPRALWRAALTGTPLPPGLLYQAVRRNRAEQRVTYPRAALIKLVLCSRRPAGADLTPAGDQYGATEETMVQLDRDSPNPAYRCGRLLAVIEEVQRLAIPGIKATVVGRFFGTASSAPASVFGRLLRGAQPHLAKLKRDRPGAYRALEARLEEIQSGLAGFPRTLTLEEQGLFALGYYHQRAHDRAQAREAVARRAADDDSKELVEDAEKEA